MKRFTTRIPPPCRLLASWPAAMAVQGLSAALGLQRPAEVSPMIASGMAAAAPAQLPISAQLYCKATKTLACQRPSTVGRPAVSARQTLAAALYTLPMRGVHTAFMPVPGTPAARCVFSRTSDSAAQLTLLDSVMRSGMCCLIRSFSKQKCVPHLQSQTETCLCCGAGLRCQDQQRRRRRQGRVLRHARRPVATAQPNKR